MLTRLANVPHTVGAEVAGVSVAVADGEEAAAMVLASPVVLLNAAECRALAGLLIEAAARCEAP